MFSQVRGILNKLTPEKFQKLSDDLLRIELQSSVILKGVIFLIFEKALDEPKYSSMYAQLCKRLAEEAPNFEPQDQTCTFRKLLLNKCKVRIRNSFEQKKKQLFFYRLNLKVGPLFSSPPMAAQDMKDNWTMTAKKMRTSAAVWRNVKCLAILNSSANWANSRYCRRTFSTNVSKNCWLGARVKILPRISNVYVRSCGRAVVSWTPTRVRWFIFF